MVLLTLLVLVDLLFLVPLLVPFLQTILLLLQNHGVQRVQLVLLPRGRLDVLMNRVCLGLLEILCFLQNLVFRVFRDVLDFLADLKNRYYRDVLESLLTLLDL